MTTEKFADDRKGIKGAGEDDESEVTSDDKIRDEAMADKAEEKVKKQAAESQEQTTRRRVRHNRG